MKKVLTILMAMILVVSVAGCSDKQNVSNDNNMQAEQTTAKDKAENNDKETKEVVEEEQVAEGVSEEEFSAIENMTQNSNFDVIIENQFIDEDAYAGDFNLEGSDAYCVTLKNNTAPKVTSVKFYAVALKENLWKRMSNTTIDLFANTNILVLETSDFSLQPGESETIAFRCQSLNFDKATTFVASYTTEDGVVHENPEAQEWIEKVIESEEN